VRLEGGAGVQGFMGEAAGVVGAGDEPLHVADAVAEVVAVPGFAAGLALAFEDEDLAWLRRGGQSSRLLEFASHFGKHQGITALRRALEILL
jgi:hypothetical protein